MELSEFLLARIAEDEAVAADANVDNATWWVDGPGERSGHWWIYATGQKFADQAIAEHIARWDPARALGECEAKRRIVEMRLRADVPEASASYLRGQDDGFRQALDESLRLLALPYADHPQYRPEWKP